MDKEKSAEAIVGTGTSRQEKAEDSQGAEGLNVKLFQMLQESSTPVRGLALH